MFHSDIDVLSFTSELTARYDVTGRNRAKMKVACLLTCLLVLILASGMSEAKTKPKKKLISRIKALLAKIGEPGGFATLDQDGNLPQDALPGGYDKYSAYDLGWQSLHMAAAAACRGSTPSGGSGCCGNVVVARNSAYKQSCTLLCSQTGYICDAGVSIYGRQGKATKNGEAVGHFYNYPCDYAEHGGSEVSDPDEGIMVQPVYYSFCCCRKG